MQEDDWVNLESATGKVTAQVSIQSSMKEGHIRVPHGWWYPESRGQENLAGLLSPAMRFCVRTKRRIFDHEQGVPHFKGFPGRIVKTTQPDVIEPAGQRLHDLSKWIGACPGELQAKVKNGWRGRCLLSKTPGCRAGSKTLAQIDPAENNDPELRDDYESKRAG